MAEISELVSRLLDEILPPDGGQPDLHAIQVEAAEVRRRLSQEPEYIKAARRVERESWGPRG